MDVNVATYSDYQTLWANGPAYSVNFYLRDRDKVHFVPTASSCSGGSQGSTSSGTSVPTTLPSTNYDFPQYYQTPTLPNSSLPYSSALPFSSGIPSLSPLTSSLTGALAAPTPTSASTPTQPAPQICAPTFSCTDGTMYYKTSACTTQVYQVCASGCSGNSCAAASSTIISNPLTASTSIFDTNTNTGTNTNANTQPSVSDILTQLTGYTFGTSTDVGTSSSIAFSLNPTTGDVGQLSTIGTGTVPVSGSIASIQPTDGQQTFTSGDLSGSSGFNTSAPASTSSGLQSIFNGMTAALHWALNVLQSLRR